MRNPIFFANIGCMEGQRRVFPDSKGGRWRSAHWLHARRFLAHPVRLASLCASSAAFGRLVAQEVRRGDDEFVLELGAGTGVVTRALLDSGIPPERLIAVEIDSEMADYLRQCFPDITVVEGSACDLRQTLPSSVIGRIGPAICGIPLSLLPLEQQKELVGVMFSLMPTGRAFLCYSHRLGNPLPLKDLGLVGRRLAFTFRNFPPASVWAFEPARQAKERAAA